MPSKDQYIAWMEEADAYAEQEFGISAVEINGGDPIDFYDVDNYDPEHWVEYKAEKYDLIRRDRWEAHGFTKL